MPIIPQVQKEVCDLYHTSLSLKVCEKAYRCGIKETGGVDDTRDGILEITPCTLIYDKCSQT